MVWIVALLLSAVGFAQGFHHGRAIGFIARAGVVDLSAQGRPGVVNTTLHWYEQTVDHFSWAPTPSGKQTFKQRYFVHKAYWRKGGPIFFYCGNEANVELYVNSTGLMWEHAQEFGAALVFAEHRYYGETMPFGKDTQHHLQFLTMEQALADYAQLLYDLKRTWNTLESKVVAFGGSYGGMLAAWLRIKYPEAVDGAISASAPVLAFPGMKHNFGDGQTFWQVVTRDATEAAGSDASCAPNVRRAWQDLFELGKTDGGRQQLTSIFRLCEPLLTLEDVRNLALMHLNAWDTMSMGNFPFPSNYLIYQQTQNPSVMLPAFPVRIACERIKGDHPAPEHRLAALREASAVLYNVSQVQCYDLPSDPNFDGVWDYQWCTEFMPQETYFTRNGVTDMFWPFLENMSAIREHCLVEFGVEPRSTWIAQEFGDVVGASNIVFSNGLYDPWSSGGVLKNVSETVVAVLIEDGAHHLDLMFSTGEDPETVKQARRTEMEHVRKWIAASRDTTLLA